MNALTLRFALPAIVIVTIITVALIAFILLTTHHAGGAWQYPGP
jgi:hypothetical protein